MSTTIGPSGPDPSSASRPITVSTAWSSASDISTASTSRAASTGEDASAAPASTTSAAFPGVRFQTLTS